MLQFRIKFFVLYDKFGYTFNTECYTGKMLLKIW